MISVIIPIFNEQKFIGRAIESVLSQDIKNIYQEIIIVDGMSTDGTRDIIKGYKKKHKNIILLDNPDKIVSIGFNKALTISRGNIIFRLDGHAEFHSDYFRKCIAIMKKKDINCVGGVITHHSYGIIGKTIQISQSSIFGVGGVDFRKTNTKAKFVDTLAFGAYKKKLFENFGGYDEDLVKNQDDELNFRIIQNGEKIWLDPTLKTIYYSRNNFKDLFSQYFYYGFYKIRVIQKRRGFASWRHLIPAVFFISLFSSFWIKVNFLEPIPFYILIAMYTFCSSVSVILEIFKNFKKFIPLSKVLSILLLPISFLIMHLSYGAGFIAGSIYFINLWKNNDLNDKHYFKKIK